MLSIPSQQTLRQACLVLLLLMQLPGVLGSAARQVHRRHDTVVPLKDKRAADTQRDRNATHTGWHGMKAMSFMRKTLGPYEEGHVVQLHGVRAALPSGHSGRSATVVRAPKAAPPEDVEGGGRQRGSGRVATAAVLQPGPAAWGRLAPEASSSSPA